MASFHNIMNMLFSFLLVVICFQPSLCFVSVTHGLHKVSVGSSRQESESTPSHSAASCKTAKSNKLTPEAEELETVLKNKHKTGKLLVAQTAPSVRVAFSELFGEKPGAFSPSLLVASLKALGFDLVLDTNTGADLTICEEGTELLNHILHREKRLNEEKTETFVGETPSFEGVGSKEENDSYHDEIKGTNTEVSIGEGHFPLFTSCCPGWLNLISKSNPELIPYVSTCKSPHMMYGAMVKHYSHELLGRDPADVYLASVMPCVRKRGESDHPIFIHNGIRDVDNVITTKDLGDLLLLHEIDPLTLDALPYDSPFREEGVDEPPAGLGTGAGQLFGATGGVMEAAVRSVYEIITHSQLPRLELDEVRGLDGVKEATIPLFNEETGEGLKHGTFLRVAVANGLGNAKKLIKAMKDGTCPPYDFVEVMACPGGCIGGGGQPKSKDSEILNERMNVIYELDKSLPIRRSHENPTVKAFYERYLQEMGSEIAHELLHVDPIYGE